MLARGELRCIGATTINEHKQNIEKDPALERRFQKIKMSQAEFENSLCTNFIKVNVINLND